MSTPWVVIGGGGHASVVIDALRACGEAVRGFTDLDPAAAPIQGVERLGGDEVLDGVAPGSVWLAVGLGSVGVAERRATAFENLRARGYRFPPVVHPAAVVAASAVLEEGAQIMAGAVVQPRCRISENAIVNTRASVDHDGDIGAHVHVAPGATISGEVRVGERSLVGAGATLIQGIRVGARCVVGAGAVVIRDVPDGATVVGVPARATP